MVRKRSTRSLISHAALCLAAALLCLASAPGAFAANPPAAQTYYVTLPEDDLLTLFDENQDALGSYAQVSSPIRSVTTISINETGTLVYYDQWEDGGYDPDIANPQNVYNAGTNPAGTQIWGDSNLANGCAPNISGALNPCTQNSDDVLQSGQVIVLDNDVVLLTGRYYVLDSFGTAAYDNNDGNQDWAGDWAETGDATGSGNYRDEFSTAVYNRSDGSLSWTSSPWSEEGDGTAPGSPTSGTIYINTTSDELRFIENSSAGDAIRRTADLSGYTSAALSFNIDGSGIDGANDAIVVEISADGGANYTLLEQFDSDPGGALRTYDISSYIASNTTLRFRMIGDLETGTGDGERWDIDNVDITVTNNADPATTGDIQVTGNQLRFTETEAADSIEREVNIPANGGVTIAGFARLTFTLGYSGVVLNGSDEFRVDISANGGSTWTPLATYGSAAGNPASNPSTQSFDIGAYAAANTRVRFYQVDPLESGKYWYVDDVEIAWGYRRDEAVVYFDGRDKVGTSSLVAMSRGAFPLAPGSVMAGASEMFDTTQWGNLYYSPVGENTPAPNTSAFEDVRWFIMGGAGGSTIDVDANADGDVTDPGDLDDVAIGEGENIVLDGIRQGATLNVVAGNPVQVNLMTSDDNDTFEFRWFGLLPPSDWTYDYYSSIGTNPQADNLGCTEVWFYNPNAFSITIRYDRPGGNAYPGYDGSITVAANGTAATPTATNLLTLGNGARFWTVDKATFLPISITDCTKSTAGTDGRIMDWGSPLVATYNLSGEVLVGLAPGCSNESHSGICHDPDSTAGGTTPDVFTPGSRNVVFVTPVATTNIYVDTNGSGMTCTPGSPPTVTGAEKSQLNATALSSYRFNDDPASRSYVHDNFGSQAFNRSDSVDGWSGNVSWSSLWSEGGGEAGNTPGSGAILINTSSPSTLRFQDDGGSDETGRFIRRNHSTSGASYARLSFQLFSATGLDADDRIAVEVSQDGTNYVTLATYVGPWYQTLPGPSFPRVEVLNISPYIGSSMYIQFKILDNLETGDWWAVDHVHIDYAAGGDFNMSGALIKTFNADCTSTQIAVAYGQEPSLTGGNDDEALDFGTLVPPYRPIVRSASIGDRVWLDEDGDGRQDAGEPGIPNVRVTLTGTSYGGTPYNLTTYTDAEGGYLFTGIESGGAYTVSVDTATLPAGLGNPTYDEDNGTATDSTPGSPNSSTVLALPAGAEHTTADFGYNWNPSADVTGNTGTSAIGDRVWIDADGDGVQDPEEIGLYNVPVQLLTAGPDGRFGTADDVVAASTTTDHNGNYIFDGLLPGVYAVRVNGGTTPFGYTQTGDPDAFGALCSACDNRTTTPVVLAPGDVFVNADFGYQPDAGTSGTIGDTLWVDAIRDNSINIGQEVGIPGVTVSLIKDLNANGQWDAGEPIIATDITDASGAYQFSGLPVADGTGTDDYLVWVNDTGDVLGELTAVYDVRDGGSQGNPTGGLVTGYEISAVTNLTSTAVTDADFAYAPAGHDAGEGLIGDTVFLDRDGNGAFGPGEGLESVTVVLRNNSGQEVARTVTNENGQYFFGGLPGGTYTVGVVVSSLPGGGSGLTNTVDPDGSLPNQSSVTITAAGINLLQDFGYRPDSGSGQPVNAISGTLWEDTDADGTLTEAGRFAGVTVTLYSDSNGNHMLDGGDTVMGATVTDGSGNYSFNNLPNGTYFVDVTDNANLLNGYWKSDGPSPGADSNSQSDPYEVTVLDGVTNTTADFGYYVDPAGLGNFVWNDTDRDGIQDAGETGISGVEVTLTITYPGGLTTVVRTLTDGSGFYSFGNLLLDENFDGVGAPEPLYSISVAAPAGLIPSPQNATSEDLDSDNPAGEPAGVTQGAVNDTYDFGFFGGYALLGDRVWYDTDGDGFQDAGEAGISGIDIIVYGPGCPAPAGCTVTTGADGIWHLEVGPGEYAVTFDAADIAALGYDTQATNMAAGNDTYVVIAAAGDILDYLDFGFRGTGVTLGAIGDRVWQDSNGDGVQDAGEAGINGVSVALIRDANGNGTWDAGEPVIHTMLTGGNGNYQFSGLPVADGAGTDDYLVWVSDSGNVLGAMTATYDLDGAAPASGQAAGLGISAVSDLTTTVVDTVDFGYRLGTGPGSIGNQVWHDLNGDGDRDTNEPGLEGAVISLYLADGVTLAGTAVTDANGNYLFANLPLGNYIVDVDAGGVLAGFTLTDGADGVDDNSQADPYSVELTEGAPADLTADFGYYAATGYALSGTVFEDNGGGEAGDGTLGTFDGASIDPVAPDAQVSLYRVVGGVEYLFGTTFTNGSGFYQFTGLPAGDYVVKADTTGTIVDGFEQTTDPEADPDRCGVGGEPPCDSRAEVTITNADITGIDFGYWNGGTTTTPVTLSYFEATPGGEGEVHFEWWTATETGNIGFMLFVEIDGGKVRINPDPILGAVNSTEPLGYRYTADAAGGDTFWIADVDIDGRVIEHGPYILGQAYGHVPEVRPIDWRQVKAEKAAEKARGGQLTLLQGEAVATAAPARVRNGDAVHLVVRRQPLDASYARVTHAVNGRVYRVTYEDLLGAGMDFGKVKISRLTLYNRGKVVPMHVVAGMDKKNKNRTQSFGPGSYLEFIGEGSDSLYTDANPYRLVVEDAKGNRAAVDTGILPAEFTPEAYYMERVTREREWDYAIESPTDDPWYDAYLTAWGGPSPVMSRTIGVDQYLAGAAPARVEVGLWGVTRSSADPDHHVVLGFNGQAGVGDHLFEGRNDGSFAVTLPDGLLTEGVNALTLRLPFDLVYGFDEYGNAGYDMIALDRYGVVYPRRFVARDGRLDFTSAGSAFTVEGLGSDEVVVYRADSGGVTRLAGVQVTGSDGDYTARFPGIGAEATYHVAGVNALGAPAIEPVAPPVDCGKGRKAAFLVIAHEDFVNDDLQRLIDARKHEGWKTALIPAGGLYTHYTHGVYDPAAIQACVEDAAARRGTKAVLLVGADTYDYQDYFETGAVSFLPSLYARTGSIVSWAPADGLFGDVDGDGLQDVAVGRFPVRTGADLANMVERTLAYAGKDYGKTAVFAADKYDTAQKHDFRADSDAILSGLSEQWVVRTAYMDELGKAGARAELIGAINDGSALTAFVGHSGPTAWTFDGLFTSADAEALTNAGRPTVVVQWGCYNTFYVSPYANSLGHSFLLSGDRGAAAVLGASTLTEADHETELGKRLFGVGGLVNDGTAIGEAILRTKRNLAQSYPDWQGGENDWRDVILGWQLLGDPLLRVNP